MLAGYLAQHPVSSRNFNNLSARVMRDPSPPRKTPVHPAGVFFILLTSINAFLRLVDFCRSNMNGTLFNDTSVL